MSQKDDERKTYEEEKEQEEEKQSKKYNDLIVPDCNNESGTAMGELREIQQKIENAKLNIIGQENAKKLWVSCCLSTALPQTAQIT